MTGTTNGTKTAKSSRPPRGAAKTIAEETLVGSGEEQETIAPSASPLQDEQVKQQQLEDDGMTADERSMFYGEKPSSEPNGEESAPASLTADEFGLDPKAALLALASSEIQGFGSNFVESVITSAQENSKMAANMIRQYPQLFYILTLQELAGSGFTGGGTEAELGKSHFLPLPIGGMESGYQQFQTIMTQAQRTVLSALPGTVLKQLPGRLEQEEATQ